jgi:hypothetical protein
MGILSSAQEDINHESIHRDLSFHICRKQQTHVHSDQGLHTNNGILQFDTASVTISATSIKILLDKAFLAFLRWCMSGCLPESQSQTYPHTFTLFITITTTLLVVITITTTFLVVITITTTFLAVITITTTLLAVITITIAPLVAILEIAMRNDYLILLAHGQTPTKTISQISSQNSLHSSLLLCPSIISCE